ncbi:toprim domain-containing protein [Thomasclavelia saccharogumia]|uniref:toprim domain-containing protein n=1 Tax=Thomasclavelia saccharogumia TaxID=341225 RepID=UPI00047AEE6F|nr:toprim domain-containing protein [Thomasclavelia saccharogumia]
MNGKDTRRKNTRNYPLLQLAEQCGYTVLPVGGSGKYYNLKEHDSLMINTRKNTFYQYSCSYGGDCVAFLMKFGRDPRFKSLDFCIRWLEKELKIAPAKKIEIPVTKSKIELIIPDQDTNNDKVIKYLTEKRCIRLEVVEKMIKNKYIYQEKSKFHNCVFVSYSDDGKPVFASKRSSQDHYRFVGDIPGSDYNHCLFIKGSTDNLVVTESMIDAMSLMTLHYDGFIGNFSENSFLALNSVSKYKAIIHHLSKNKNIDTVILALDNDQAGIKACEIIKKEIKEYNKSIWVCNHLPENCKDWNEELKNSFLKKNTLKK